MKCPHCNQEHPNGFQFCPTTGQKINALRACSNPECPNCGKYILSFDSRFCPLCGSKLFENPKSENKDSSKLTFTVCGVSFKMIKVDAGTFMMGCKTGERRERHVHEVSLSSYYIGETQVTQALWLAVMGDNPSDFMGENNPVNRVNWFDCEIFLNKLNELTHKIFRLPTEAEWEFAAKGGKKSRGYQYAGSDDIEKVAWFDENSNSEVHPVARKKPNELGIYDMSGNVWEWCQDWGDRDYYKQSIDRNPKGPSSGSDRVCRGGGRSSIAGNCRVTYRNFNSPENKRSSIGLRIVIDGV